jgi:hypothetical protein
MFGQRSDCKVKTTPFAICGLAKKWHYKTNVTCRLFLHTHHPHQDLNLDIFVAQSSSYLRTNANISHSSTNMAVTDPTLKPRSNYHSSHTVVLLVGKEQQEMLVHTNIISAHSTFFRTALKKEWKEGQTRVIKLPEDDPDIVTRYLDFVYHNRLVTQCKSQPDANHIDLALLYVYGERVLDTYIQNTIVEHLLKLTAVIDRNKAGHPHYPGPAVVEITYEGTTAALPFRRLLIDMYARHGSEEWLSHDDLHPAFCLDVARALVAQAMAKDGVPGKLGAAMRMVDYLIAE